MKLTPISAESFLKAWKETCKAKGIQLLAAWDSPPNYTSEIFKVENAIIKEVADKLELKVYSGYYSLDAVFFDASDKVHCAPANETWVQNIRIAFEHENTFRSGLYQEASHLLVTRADLRVLVTYPENYEVNDELEKLNKMISNSNLTDPAFLLIMGVRNAARNDISWIAYTCQDNLLLELKS